MRLLVHAQPMRHESMRVRFSVQNCQTKTGIGSWHVMKRWWQRLRPALEKGLTEEEIPFEIEEVMGTACVENPEDEQC